MGVEMENIAIGERGEGGEGAIQIFTEYALFEKEKNIFSSSSFAELFQRLSHIYC